MRYSKDSLEAQFLYLTTTGRKTGLPRRIEIWFVQDAGKLYVLAEHFHSTQWVKNILRDPKVLVQLAGQEFKATARVLDPEGDADAWNRAQQFARNKYGWGEGLPVEIDVLVRDGELQEGEWQIEN